MEKRDQVTIFIIIGIVIVALVVLFVAFRKDIASTITGVVPRQKMIPADGGF